MEYDRTDLLLGIVCFLNKSPKVLAHVAITIPDLDEIQDVSNKEFTAYRECVLALFKLHPNLFHEPPPQNPEEYIRNGVQARKSGVSPIIYNILYKPTPKSRPDYSVELFPPYYRNRWDQIEGTLNKDILHDRYTALASWEGNSCAPDAALFVGLCSKVAIQQIDTISFAEFRRLSPAQMMFRELMCLPWGSMCQTERDSARDVWRKLLHAELKDTPPDVALRSSGKAMARWEEGKRMFDINDVVDLCLKGLPSYSFTTKTGWVCCGTQVKTNPKVKIQQYSVITCLPSITNGSLGERVGDYLRLSTKQRKAALFCGQKNCTRVRARAQIVLDRMPPLLAIGVAEGGVKLILKDRWGLFEDICLQYLTVKGKRTKSYTTAGAILCVGSAQNHFVARWKTMPLGYIHYDSNKSSRFIKKSSWEDGLDPSIDSVRMLFFRELY